MKIKKVICYVKENGIKKSFKKAKSVLLKGKCYASMNEDYQKWIKKNEPTEKELQEQRKHHFSYEPKISVVIPMYHTNETFFLELVHAFQSQTYSNFEVCLADGSKEKNDNLEKMVKDDNRFCYRFLGRPGGISDNTNEALKMATGEYIAFMDHDDLLPAFALFEVVKAINENKEVDFIYTDEDNITNQHKRKNPHLKPDFSPDTLRSYNYICHFVVVKKTLFDKVGFLNSQLDGAQDYDFVLRATEKAQKIVHIPKILYHWRAHENSTSQNTSSKSYTGLAGQKAIENHLERMKLKGRVIPQELPGTYQVQYDIVENPKISILIPNKDSREDLKKCIDSILTSTYQNYEIIVIENNSVDQETFRFYEELKKNDQIKVVTFETDEFNFSSINNFGRKYATGQYLLFLNNDVEIITKDWLENMLGLCQRDDVGIVGAKLLYYDNTVQHAGVIIGMGGVAGHIHKDIKDEEYGYFSRASLINNYYAVTAACLMIKAKIFDEVKGFDETLKVAFNDVDLCMKVREKNYLVVYTPYAKLYHYESKSRGYEDTKEKKERFAKEIQTFQSKWKERLRQGDPYFNINLRLDTATFCIRTDKIEIGE